MVNASYTPEGNMLAYVDGEEVVMNKGDSAWILIAFALVFSMAPGVGFLYSGLLRRKNALSMLFLALMVFSVIQVEWYLWGYSLAFGDGSSFIGNLANGGLVNVDYTPSGNIPVLLFALYQGAFAGVTAVIAIGGSAERCRIVPLLVFIFCWSTIVYNPIACWVWNANGWLFSLGDLDYAGGGPVHISSGTAGLALSFFLGRRRGYGTQKLAFRPHSVSHIVIGTLFLWFGWFGFNGGSALGMNLRAVQSCIATNAAAAMGAITWTLLDYIYTRKFSAVSLCSGVLAGLVGITPGAGYVGMPASLAIGFVTAIASNYATGIKVLLKIDDAVDTFALHGIGGFVGAILTALFADERVTSFDPAAAGAGWINHNYIALGYNLAGAVTIMAYAFVMTLVLCYIINFIPGLKFRVDEDAEIVGLDEAECGELAYDYVSLRKEVEPEEATLGGSLHSPSATSHEHEKAAPGVATAAAKEQ
ncbi:ammonium transporter [Rhodotorula paludigena]|uniref:Ammonium transporter n=1 Tax=Rhodotorula paludigena TaxID=86838 RepID=A0AAV5GTK5_9BASI|nr:hypothetical protein Rhopal_006600-T1 [Rhodotorula paludigena]